MGIAGGHGQWSGALRRRLTAYTVLLFGNGISRKLVHIIQSLYENSERRVIHNSQPMEHWSETRMCSVTRVILSRNRLGYEDRHTRQKTGIAVDSDLNPRGTGLCWLPLSQQTPRHPAKDIVPQQNRNEINNYKTQNTTNSDPILGGVSLGFIVLLENFSLIWRRHHFRWRAPNCDSLVGSADPGVGVFVTVSSRGDFAYQVCEHQSVL